MTSTATVVETAPAAAAVPVGVIKLKAPVRRVVWGDEVVDNEGLGKRSSKSTCSAHVSFAAAGSRSACFRDTVLCLACGYAPYGHSCVWRWRSHGLCCTEMATMRMCEHSFVRGAECCIYHKPRRFGESSSDEDSDSTSSAGSDAEDHKAGDHPRKHKCRHHHAHDAREGARNDGRDDSRADVDAERRAAQPVARAAAPLTPADGPGGPGVEKNDVK
jgi:hypothetical protein